MDFAALAQHFSAAHSEVAASGSASSSQSLPLSPSPLSENPESAQEQAKAIIEGSTPELRMEVAKMLMHAAAGTVEKHALILQMTESARFFPVSGLEVRLLLR